jgi:hypothetical protein
MSKYLFLYNEPFEYIHFIDMLYREFHLCYKMRYDTYNIINVSKSSFTRLSYAIELNLDDNVSEKLLKYYKTKVDADLIPFDDVDGLLNDKRKYRNGKHNEFNTDICFKQQSMNPQKRSHQKVNVENSVLGELRSFKKNTHRKRHISKDVFDELYGLLDYEKHE